MPIVLVEGFSWAGTSPITGVPAASQLTNFITRYNFPQSSGGSSLPPLGRFGGNCLQQGGGTYFQQLILPGGPIATGRVVTGFAFASTFVAGFDGIIFDLRETGIVVQVAIGIKGGHLTVVKFDGTVVKIGPTILQNNSYYYVEVDAVIGHAGSVQVNLEGVSEITVPLLDTQQGATNQVISFSLDSPGAGALYRVCDMYMKDDAGFLGPCRVITSKPTGDGALLQWTPLVPGPHFSQVNEDDPDGDTSYVSDATPGDIDLYTFPPLPYTPNSIYAAQPSYFARKDDVAVRTISSEVRSGGANFPGVVQPVVTSTYLDIFRQIYPTDPNTGLPWTPAGLNAAQFGIRLVS